MGRASQCCHYVNLIRPASHSTKIRIRTIAVAAAATFRSVHPVNTWISFDSMCNAQYYCYFVFRWGVGIYFPFFLQVCVCICGLRTTQHKSAVTHTYFSSRHTNSRQPILMPVKKHSLNALRTRTQYNAIERFQQSNTIEYRRLDSTRYWCVHCTHRVKYDEISVLRFNIVNYW